MRMLSTIPDGFGLLQGFGDSYVEGEGSFRWLRNVLNRIGQVLTWLCVATLVILSLIPGEARPHTGYQGGLEHAVAYGGTALVATLAYRRPAWAAGGLFILSLILELIQMLIPGRGASVADTLFSTAGAATGALTAALIMIADIKIRARPHGGQSPDRPSPGD